MVNATDALALLSAHGLHGPFAVHQGATPGIVDRRMNQVFIGVKGNEAAIRRALSGRLTDQESFEELIESVTDDCMILAAWDLPHSGGVPAAIQIVDRLLGPGGCPWDQEQTHDSLKRHLIEECYELIEAIESGSNERMREELGDVMLQPIMHAQMIFRDGGFDSDEVVQTLVEKLIRRHPHVFGDQFVASADEVLQNWDSIKLLEKGEDSASVLGSVPTTLPSLLRAFEISKRAARVGFEWPSLDAVLEKLGEEEAELREALIANRREEIESEIGDLLFTIVNVARWCGIEPEEALRKMLERFSRRFRGMEKAAQGRLGELTPQDWDDLWVAQKAME